MATDGMQRLREAAVTILDTAAAVTTLTGRGSGNVVPSFTQAAGTVPAIAYTLVVATEEDGLGDMRRAQFQFSAFAATESLANELCGAVESTLTGPAFAALAAPIDARVTRLVRRAVPASETPKRADLDLTLVARLG